MTKKIGVNRCDPQTEQDRVAAPAPWLGKVLLHLPLG
jgi:hypothetical protein